MKSKSLIIISISLAVYAVACSEGKTEAIETKKIKSAIPAPEVVHPRADRPLYSLTLPAELKPYEQVDVYAKTKAFVKKIYVDRGSRVKKGQLLALLEAPEINQQLLSARSDERKLYESYLYSRQAYGRLKKAALKSGAVADIELDRAGAQLRADSAAYYSAKASTEASVQLAGYLQITAPFDGTVIRKNISAGALVGANNTESLFSIAQQEKLRLTVAIPEKHAHSVSKHTLVTFTVSNRPGKVYSAKISRNSLLVNASDRSVTLEFDVNNGDLSLSGGEFAQAKLSLQRPEPSIWLPAKSIVQAQSGVFILKVEDGAIKRIPVILGIRDKEMQEVFGDIKPEETIIKAGSEEIEEGTKVSLNQ